MTEQRGKKLNRLQRQLPEGLLANAAWLQENGYSRSLCSQYVASGWLEQPVRGVYRRPGGKLQWQHVIISLQTLLRTPVIVGGRTALEMQGFSHYVSVDESQEVHLYSIRPLPGWIGQLDLRMHFVLHRTQRLFRQETAAGSLKHMIWDANALTTASDEVVHGGLIRLRWGHWNWPLTLSTPERAILEILDEVPLRETFHQVDMLMEGLPSLSPRRLQQLLEGCSSVKVKRLLLWFAEQHRFSWLNHLNQDHIDLGKGKRSLVRGGKLDPKYLITVPEDLHGLQ